MSADSETQIIAHRGYSAKAPENTLSALEAALDAGADAVEFDVQTAACGTPVLFHDPMLGRTTNGVGPVQRRPVGLLKALDAGSWFGPEFAEERIPTQEEALRLLHGRVGQVYQDIKGYRELEDLDRMVETTRQAGMDEVTVFVSADGVVLRRLREVAPEIRRAYLVNGTQELTEALRLSREDDGAFLSLEIRLCLDQPERVREAQEAGVEVVTWTVDDEEEASRALALGIRRVTTNEVSRLLSWKSSLAGR